MTESEEVTEEGHRYVPSVAYRRLSWKFHCTECLHFAVAAVVLLLSAVVGDLQDGCGGGGGDACA